MFENRTRRVEAPGLINRQGRRPCHIHAQLSTANRDGHCVVENLSQGGAAISTSSILKLRPGEQILLSSRELGTCAATIRWAAHPRYGIEFDSQGKASEVLKRTYDLLEPVEE